MKTNFCLLGILLIAGVFLSSCSGPGYGRYGGCHINNITQQEAGGR